MQNGAGFNRHPTDCDKFVQCYFGPGGMKQYSYQECPWGNFWDQDSLTCQPPHRVSCQQGRKFFTGMRRFFRRILRKLVQRGFMKKIPTLRDARSFKQRFRPRAWRKILDSNKSRMRIGSKLNKSSDEKDD